MAPTQHEALLTANKRHTERLAWPVASFAAFWANSHTKDTSNHLRAEMFIPGMRAARQEEIPFERIEENFRAYNVSVERSGLN